MITASDKTISKEHYKKAWAEGISFDEYKKNMALDLAANPDSKVREYIHLNQARLSRIEKTYQVSASLTEAVMRLKNKTYWLILTEHWCGDAAQNLPVLNAVAKASKGKIEMKLVYRDQQSELMDAHLSNGTRSIPKLIQLNENYTLSGIWGPRPVVAQKLVAELKSNPATAINYANELHLWYAKNKQQELEKEIAKLVLRANLLCTDCLS
jgi:Thioredoxin